MKENLAYSYSYPVRTMAQLYELFQNFDSARAAEDWEKGIKILDKSATQALP